MMWFNTIAQKRFFCTFWGFFTNVNTNIDEKFFYKCKSQSYNGFGATFKDYLSPPTCGTAATFFTSPIQPDHVQFHRASPMSLDLSPSHVSHPCLTTFIIKKSLPYAQSKPTLFQCKAVVSCSVTKVSLHQYTKPTLHTENSEPSLLQSVQPQLSQSFLIGEVVSPLITFITTKSKHHKS